MEQAQSFSTPMTPGRYFVNPAGAQKQLEREISCLEKQLDRLRLRRDLLDDSTLSNYQEMILSRQSMLDELAYKK